jgi:hypothetical protein
MDLHKKFREDGSCTTLAINRLEVDRKYPIEQAKRVYTRFGPTILLSLSDLLLRPLKVFLPRQYADVFTDSDVEEINLAKMKLNLIYKAKCTETKFFKVEIGRSYFFADESYCAFRIGNTHASPQY